MDDEAKEILSRSLVHQIERLRAENERLRAELDAERDNNKSLNKHLTRARGNIQKMKAERDALRALLREEKVLNPTNFYAADRLRVRIDALLNKGGMDD